MSEPLSLGLQRGDIQGEDELFKDNFRVVAKGGVLSVGQGLELEGEDLDFDKGARALLYRLEYLDVGAEEDLRDQDIHCFEP